MTGLPLLRRCGHSPVLQLLRRCGHGPVLATRRPESTSGLPGGPSTLPPGGLIAICPDPTTKIPKAPPVDTVADTSSEAYIRLKDFELMGLECLSYTADEKGLVNFEYRLMKKNKP